VHAADLLSITQSTLKGNLG